MSRQAIINENNIVTNVIAGSVPYGLTLEEGEFCEPGATYVPNGTPRFLRAPRVYTWTSYQFLNRFTASERAEVRSRSLTDTNVADFLMLATAAQEVVSNDPVTIQGMGYLVSIGVLTAQRRDEILNGSV